MLLFVDKLGFCTQILIRKAKDISIAQNRLKTTNLGESPGLVVMLGDSCSEGRRFESQHHILDGLFLH